MDRVEITDSFKETRAAGKKLRARIKRSEHGSFKPSGRDPVSIIEEQNQTRLQQLVPVRIGRMLESRFAYYRGTAGPMAFDLSTEVRTDLRVVGCGDAHVANFGLFASPDRRMIFDLNDFDEAGPSPWEWDVKRLVASVEIGFRHRGFDAAASREACRGAVREYRERLFILAGMDAIERYYFRVEAQDMRDMAVDRAGQKAIDKTMKKARRRNSDRVLSKITTAEKDGVPRIENQPPILQHIKDAVSIDEVTHIFERYRETLRPDISLLLSRFELVDYALRVVGVGSVGTRCLIFLLIGPQGEPVFLQLKEAQRSVLETYGGIPPSPLIGLGEDNTSGQGFRVVSSQQVLQAASDPFLGWITGVRGIDYYGRQFRDMKGSADLEALTVGQFARYGRVCGALLARAHSQSPGWAAILGYLGKSDVFDRSIADWSKSYADQVETDYEALEAAVKSGRIPCETGI